MQVHEITTKINEGVLDAWKEKATAAVKGIGSIAASGVNQALGTNIGGALAGTQVGPGQRQQVAMQINQAAAAKQARVLSDQYIRSVTSLMKQAGVQKPSQLDVAAQGQARKEIDQIIFKQLLGNAYVQDLNQLNTKVDKPTKPQMAALVTKINAARRGLYDLTVALNPSESLRYWTELTTASAEALNLATFNKSQASTGGGFGGAAPSTQPSDITVSAAGDWLYRGQPYNSADPAQKAAMAQWMKQNYRKP